MSKPPQNLQNSMQSQGITNQNAGSGGHVLSSGGVTWTKADNPYVPRFRATGPRFEAGDVVRVLCSGVYDGMFELSKGDVGTIHTSTNTAVSVTFWRHPHKLMIFEPHTLEKFEP